MLSGEAIHNLRIEVVQHRTPVVEENERHAGLRAKLTISKADTSGSDETVGGEHCHVIEFTPAGKDLTYGKILTWLTDDLVLVKFEMYDKSGRLEKVLSMTDFRKLGQIPTPFRMEVQNVQGGSHTVVTFSEVKYDSGLADALFTERSLGTWDSQKSRPRRWTCVSSWSRRSTSQPSGPS